jgi:hypothetical protein
MEAAGESGRKWIAIRAVGIASKYSLQVELKIPTLCGYLVTPPLQSCNYLPMQPI